MNAERFLVEYLSPTRREALKPHSLVVKGARGLGFKDIEVKHNTFQTFSKNFDLRIKIYLLI